MAEHVSFFRAKALPGKRQAVLEQFEKWDREQKAKAKRSSCPMPCRR